MSTFQIKILAIGDPHFDGKNAAQTDAMARETEAVVAANPDIAAVVVLGDVLHRFGSDSVHALARAVAFLRDLRRALAAHDARDAASGAQHAPPRQLWVIIGNHERPNRQVFLTSEHQLTALHEWPNTVVADRAVAARLRGRDFLLVPYVEPGRFREAIRTLDAGPPDPALPYGSTALARATAVFAHQEFRGARLGGGGLSTAGDEYPAGAPLCVSGHIHEFSQPHPNVLYVGTPFDGGWARAAAPRAEGDHALSLLTFGRQSRLIAHERIRLETVPRNVTLAFGSAAEFALAIERARAADPGAPRATLGALLRERGLSDAEVARVAAARVKVRTATRDEYNALIARSRAISELAQDGVAVSHALGDAADAPSAAAPVSAPLATARPFAARLAEELARSRAACPRSAAVADFIAEALPLAGLARATRDDADGGGGK